MPKYKINNSAFFRLKYVQYVRVKTAGSVVWAFVSARGCPIALSAPNMFRQELDFGGIYKNIIQLKFGTECKPS